MSKSDHIKSFSQACVCTGCSLGALSILAGGFSIATGNGDLKTTTIIATAAVLTLAGRFLGAAAEPYFKTNDQLQRKWTSTAAGVGIGVLSLASAHFCFANASSSYAIQKDNNKAIELAKPSLPKLTTPVKLIHSQSFSPNH